MLAAETENIEIVFHQYFGLFRSKEKKTICYAVHNCVFNECSLGSCLHFG